MKNRINLHVLTALLVVIGLAVAVLPATPAAAEVDDRFEVKFTGVIRTVPTSAGAPWVIGGQTVGVDRATRVILTKGPATAGQWAEVNARTDADGALIASRITVLPPEVRLHGPIMARPDAPVTAGAWIIAGQTVWVTETTRIDSRGGRLVVGGWAEVVAVEQTPAAPAAAAANRLVALRLRGTEPMPEVQATGAIQVFNDAQWVLSTLPFSVTVDTIIVGEPQVDLIAHAAATLDEAGALSAARLRVAWVTPQDIRRPVEFVGVVQALPPHDLIGQWRVGDRDVMVSANTAIHQERGLVVVGARVKVNGFALRDKVIAMEITVLDSPVTEGQPLRFSGVLKALPASGLIGDWTIDDLTVTVTERTKIEGVRLVKIGARVQGQGIRLPDGKVIATWLRVLPDERPGPPTAPQPKS